MGNMPSMPDGSVNPISIEMLISPTINYATQQNDVPVIHSLRISNHTNSVLHELQLKIETEPAFAVPLEKTVAYIGPEQTYDLGTLDLTLSHDFLSTLNERVTGVVHVTAESTAGVVRKSEKVWVLAYDEWSGLSGIPEMVAAFVLPNHPAVESILEMAAAFLQQWTGDSSLSGYQSKNRKRVVETAAAIYVALQNLGIKYVSSPASFEESGQKIRTPDRILDSKLGTSLDLATLAAACLEQAGLHPLICFAAKHAFTGVWVDDECFPDCSVDNVLRVRKRVELGEICVFDTTLVTSGPKESFIRAVKEAKNVLSDDDEFLCVVDIRRSRMSRIRPLPVRSGLLTAKDSHSLPHADVAYPDMEPAIVSSLADSEISKGSPAEEPPSSRLDKWKRKLLDLSMNNRLLNFRETKKTLPVLCPDLEYLGNKLADGQTLRLHARPAEFENSGPRNLDIHRRRTGDNALEELLREELKAHRLRADAVEDEMSRRLVEIYREARTSLEESGANTLYLALGFLSWRQSSEADQARLAPLILVPLEIERPSVSEPFSVRQGDDDPMVNVTLLELLKHDFDLSIAGLDPIPEDERGIRVGYILEQFRKAIRNFDGWEVLERAYIAHLSFTKFLMWHDLEARTEDLQNNKIVRHLINCPCEPLDTQGDLPDPDNLDDAYEPSRVLCPLEADSSQLAAVCAAAEGKSFVLHGPPGTGKSQTITNMIAHCIANGKSVLFVSEKRAALDVVHQRLVQSGLGPFCLELHSNKSRKSNVIRQLGESLDGFYEKSSEEWKRQADRLAELRRELNAYVRALHQPRETGESVFEGLAQLIGLRDAVHIPMGWSPDKCVDRELLDKLRDVVRELENAAKDTEHPGVCVWACVQREEHTHEWQHKVSAALDELRARCDELREPAQEVGILLGIGEDAWSYNDLRKMHAASRLLLDSPAIPAEMMTATDWDTSAALIGRWIEHGKKRDDLRRKLGTRYDTRGLLQLDLDGLEKRLVDAETSWFLRSRFVRWTVKRSLQSVTQPGQKVEPSSVLQDVRAACALRAEEQYIAKACSRAEKLLGDVWQDGEPDWELVARMTSTVSELRKLAAEIRGIDIERTSALRQTWSKIVSEGHEQLSSEGRIGRLLLDYQEKARRYLEARIALEEILSLDVAAAWGDPDAPDHICSVTSQLDAWTQHLDGLRSWCHWRAVRHRALDLGLNALIEQYELGKLHATEICTAFERSFYQWWVEQITDHDPVLRSFSSRGIEDKIQRFCETDQRYIELTRGEIQARLASRLPRRGQTTSQNSEMGILLRERQKRSRHMPIRKLFQKIPNILPRLKPCLLMSPISVAQYLDASHPPFDLVIFDEASQMPVWDAVGAIARGRELIVVGDEKQLPPTNFFMRSLDSDLESVAEDEVEDLESILDECISAQLPSMYLRWHYRSRHESLIAFSNYHYYDNKLLTFPSPNDEVGICLRLVPRGTYDKSKSRTNRTEAEAVVAEILRRLSDPELRRYSIGVVTFSISQQELIEDLLDDARRKNPEIENHFYSQTAPNNEPIFVKNLENVQGDERDVVLFSICYGPDANGRLSMNFGPLNREGGHRRLNVAITRARREVMVFSSIRADDIDLSRTRARGAADLRSFLDYAERGMAALAEHRSVDHLAECESPFERQVCEELRNLGYTVHTQVGCSGYRIDLAIVDPEHPGRYLLGIECDGANYHRAKTARDRDRIREKVLKDLGWRLHRVWSTDWWERPDRELERIKDAIEAAKKQPPSRPREETSADSETALADSICGSTAESRKHATGLANLANANMRRYEPYEVAGLRGNLDSFYDFRTDKVIKQIIENVVEQEGPISIRLASSRVAAHWGIRRVGDRVRERISHVLRHTKVVVRKNGSRVFLWPDGVDPDRYELFRVSDNGDSTRRHPDDLPPEEVANAALHVLQSEISTPERDLVIQTSRIFGFARTGKDVERSMQSGIEILLNRGYAMRKDGMIVLGRSTVIQAD